MSSFCPPISSNDVLDFSPSVQRVYLAQAAFDEAVLLPADAPAEDLAANTAKNEALGKALADAEAALASDDTTFRIKPPTGRTKAAASRELTTACAAEKIVLISNAELLDAVLADADISADDRAFVERLRAGLTYTGSIQGDDWSRLWKIALTVEAAALGIENLKFYRTLQRIALVKHHVLVAGYRTPLPDTVLSAIGSDDFELIANRIEEMISPTKAIAKN